MNQWDQPELFPDRFATRGELNLMSKGRGSAARHVTAAGKVRYDRAAGYAAKPGSGPTAETCRTCAHAVKHYDFWKCVLVRARWSHSSATDIRLKSPACARWQEKTQPAEESVSARFTP